MRRPAGGGPRHGVAMSTEPTVAVCSSCPAGGYDASMAPTRPAVYRPSRRRLATLLRAAATIVRPIGACVIPRMSHAPKPEKLDCQSLTRRERCVASTAPRQDLAHTGRDNQPARHPARSCIHGADAAGTGGQGMQARQSGEWRRVLVFAKQRDVLRYLRAAGPAGSPYAA
jgi:hypothetical protein